jgi:hypothetical protein
MLKAKRPDAGLFRYNYVLYEIFKTFTTKLKAMDYARKVRTRTGRLHLDTMTRAITVDLGPAAGKERYAVFVARGKPIKRGR